MALTLLGACSDNNDSGTEALPSSAAGPSTTVPCTGEPIKLMSIVSTTGPLSDARFAAGIEAAAKAVNAACAAKRPIEMTICDDGSDPNKAQACARRAVDGKYVALVGSVSAVTDGAFAITDAAGIPNFGNPGTSGGQLSSASSFPLGGSIVSALSHATIIAAAGGKTMTLVGPDIPQIQLLSTLMKSIATKLGVSLDKTVLIPVDATDYAQYAAQAEGTDGIAILSSGSQTKAMVQALIDAGTDFTKTIVSLPGTVTPDDITSFGGQANGIYIGYNAFPVSSTDNKGVAQYLAEMKAAGKADLATGGSGLVVWRSVHLMAEEVIPKLATVDSASVLAFLKTASFAPVDIPPTDYNKPGFPDDPTLSKLRIFSNEFVPARIVDGKIVAAADSFVPADKPFKLTK
jgi:ABC-type branched-subunit amino acid transport system substrate-binding protein